MAFSIQQLHTPEKYKPLFLFSISFLAALLLLGIILLILALHHATQTTTIIPNISNWKQTIDENCQCSFYTPVIAQKSMTQNSVQFTASDKDTQYILTAKAALISEIQNELTSYKERQQEYIQITNDQLIASDTQQFQNNTAYLYTTYNKSADLYTQSLLSYQSGVLYTFSLTSPTSPDQQNFLNFVDSFSLIQ